MTFRCRKRSSLGDEGFPQPNQFDVKAGGTAWKSKPSWYSIGKKDRTVHPDPERAMAKRIGATTCEFDSDHVPMLSQPERVIDVIPYRRKRSQKPAAAGSAFRSVSLFSWVGDSVLFHGRAERNYLKSGLKMSRDLQRI